MKKGQILEGTILRTDFPGKSIVDVPDTDREISLKEGVPGEKIQMMVTKIRKGRAEGQMTQILETAPEETAPDCPHFGECGGCRYRQLSYEAQLKLKGEQIKRILAPVCPALPFEGIKASPAVVGYRNKMEFTFGDEYKGGPLSLGMHKKNSFYDIVTVDHCRIVNEDFRKILRCVLDICASSRLPFYHRLSHEGVLRHLLVRRAAKTGEILICLVTTTQASAKETAALDGQLVRALCSLSLEGKIAGILHTYNDSLADVIRNDRTEKLYGQDFFYEELLGLKFRISPFSFFQTNSLGAEVLYQTARDYIGDTKDKVIYDLYTGTGTIAQILSPVAKHVTGVEIVEEAVEAAEINAAANGLHNCTFIAGDVLAVLDSLREKPDLIMLDPPREGIHPGALEKILHYGVDHMVYISCKPTSLARDLEVFQSHGYRVERCSAVDMFPGTSHVETVVLLSKE